MDVDVLSTVEEVGSRRSKRSRTIANSHGSGHEEKHNGAGKRPDRPKESILRKS